MPFAGYAVRFAAVQLPATAQVVAASMLGLSGTKNLPEGGSNCLPWCFAPPSPDHLAKTVALGSVPFTSAYAAIAAFRSPERFSELLSAFLAGSTLLGMFGANALAAVTGSAMTKSHDKFATVVAAQVGSWGLFFIEFGILLACSATSHVVGKFDETCMGRQRHEESLAELDSLSLPSAATSDEAAPLLDVPTTPSALHAEKAAEPAQPDPPKYV